MGTQWEAAIERTEVAGIERELRHFILKVARELEWPQGYATERLSVVKTGAPDSEGKEEAFNELSII